MNMNEVKLNEASPLFQPLLTHSSLILQGPKGDKGDKGEMVSIIFKPKYLLIYTFIFSTKQFSTS